MLETKIEPINRDLDVIFAGTLSPEARSKFLADFAREALADGEEQNASVLGHKPPHRTFVDGTENQDIDRVRPDGTIVYEFELVSELLIWIADQLQSHAPVKTGRFRSSFLVFADGDEVDVGADIQIAQEYVFLNIQPYARKIERGLSPQAPEGVFEAVAALASARFGNMAKVRFSYRTPISGALVGGKRGDRATNRTPAIIVTPR